MTHKEYHPHLTLAYVKKGSCQDLIGIDYFYGDNCVNKKVEYSDCEDVHTEISLNGR